MPESPGADRLASSRWHLPALLALQVAVGGFLVLRSVCTAPDSERYLIYAERLSQEPWGDVLRSSVDHPGYPVLLCAALTLGDALGCDSPASRLLVGQSLTVVLGLVLVTAAWIALRRLWGPRTAWFSVATFALLPRPARLGADVLSDVLHAGLWLLAAGAAIRGLEQRRARPFLAAGVAGSLAYTVRVDAITFPAALAGAACLVAARREWREGWSLPRAAGAAGLFLLPLLSTLVGFVLVYGKISPKPSFSVLLDLSWADAGAAVTGPASALLARPIVLGDPPGLVAALGHSFNRLLLYLQYIHLALALVAIPVVLRRRSPPGTALVLAAALVYWLLIAAIQVRLRYVEGRYFLPVLPLLVGLGMHGFQALAPRLVGLPWVGRRAAWLLRPERTLPLLLAVSLALSLPSVVRRRPHADYSGIVSAGHWIARHAEPDATVHDPYFFASWMGDFRDRTVEEVAPADRRTPHYIIAEDQDRQLLPGLPELITTGRVREVAAFRRRPRSREPDIRVWRLDP